MEWKKVKWLIIALLLAVNIFLGVNITIRYTTAINHEKQDLTRAVSLVDSALGFEASLFEDLPRYLYSYEGLRYFDGEKKTAWSLLGAEGSLSDAGGGVYTFVLPTKERIIFRRGGTFEGIVSIPAQSPETAIAAILEDSGLSFEEKDGVFSFEYDGISIYNAAFSYTEAGSYMSVSGRLPLCRNWEKTEKSRSRSEMVLALAEAMSENAMGNLQKVSSVYFLQSDGSSDLKLTPAWVALCDGGSIVLSITDKTVLAVEK